MISNLLFRRAQISLEYLLITAFAIAILIPGIYFFYSYSQGSNMEVLSTQFAKIGNDFLSTALKTSAEGEGSWHTLEVSIPESIVNISINESEHEITIFFMSDKGLTEAVFFPVVPVRGAFLDGRSPFIDGVVHPGKVFFRFVKRPGGVIEVGEVVKN